MTNEQKKYQTILLDPPWKSLQSGSRGACRHYSLLSNEEIAGLPIPDLAAPDSHIYIWVTNATIRDGFEMLEKWGFTYRSTITWFKPRLGLGNYYRLCTEHVLFGTRGKSPILCNKQPNWLLAPVQDHSHKPEELYAIIERCSPGPYLELFARRPQHGWDSWGNELPDGADIEIPGYPVPKYKNKNIKRKV